MHVSLLEHQLIYCTRRISRIKTRGVHKIIKFCSFKNYTVDAYKTALKKINFLNYEIFRFLSENNGSHWQCKIKWVKGNIQTWFNEEVLKQLSLRGKLFWLFSEGKLLKNNGKPISLLFKFFNPWSVSHKKYLKKKK